MFPGLKRLRRLPHIFNKVLELPFRSDTEVHVEENPDHFLFVATTDAVGNDARTHTVEIYPGVVKIVIRGSKVIELTSDEFEIDLWRFRLPPSTRPELARAAYLNGELVVTVPKDVNSDTIARGNQEAIWVGEGNKDIKSEMGRLILVQ